MDSNVSFILDSKLIVVIQLIWSSEWIGGRFEKSSISYPNKLYLEFENACIFSCDVYITDLQFKLSHFWLYQHHFKWDNGQITHPIPWGYLVLTWRSVLRLGGAFVIVQLIADLFKHVSRVTRRFYVKYVLLLWIVYIRRLTYI